MVNWIAEGSSMDVATDSDKMAHCHACLQDCEDAEDQQQMDMAVMVEYALASHFLGKFITSPVARDLTGASNKDVGKTKGRNTRGAKTISATAAGNTAGKTWVRRSTSAGRDAATVAQSTPARPSFAMAAGTTKQP
jgi:hypothetical protein